MATCSATAHLSASFEAWGGLVTRSGQWEISSSSGWGFLEVHAVSMRAQRMVIAQCRTAHLLRTPIGSSLLTPVYWDCPIFVCRAQASGILLLQIPRNGVKPCPQRLKGWRETLIWACSRVSKGRLDPTIEVQSWDYIHTSQEITVQVLGDTKLSLAKASNSFQSW